MEMRIYEGMFLLEPGQASQEWESTKKQVLSMLERRGAEIINAKKWGERKFAYEIKGHKRGTYLLIYFKMAPGNLSVLKRDLQLSEFVLRNMILVHRKQFNIPEIPENLDAEKVTDGSPEAPKSEEDKKSDE